MNSKMRIYHRYLGFFLAGIMAVYAISGILLIFRETEFLKSERDIIKEISPTTPVEEVGKVLKIRDFKIEKEEGEFIYFKNGKYNKTTGVAEYKAKQLPYVLDKMTKLHKASTSQSLFFLNIFFGVALLFFVLSSFWMFMPSTDVFRKGLYFSLAGLALALILLFL